VPIGDFEHLLEQYADVVVRIGVNVQVGQRVLIAAPIEAADFVHLIAAKAYNIGARLVEVIWGDDSLTLSRLKYAPHDSFDEFSRWLPVAYQGGHDHGDALISMRSLRFGLYEGIDPALLGKIHSTYYANMRPIFDLRWDGMQSWTVISYPTWDWAAKVFPHLPTDQQMEQLWNTMFKLVRADTPDPIAAWQSHLENLKTRAEYLTAKDYKSVHFSGLGTDLFVGLAEPVKPFPAWSGGPAILKNGVNFAPNIPTEEVASAPHREHVNGTVRATKPLNFGGALIEDFSLTFQDGCVVDFKASKGEAVLREIIETDEGSARLAEVALVPHNSPISQSGLLFYDTLYDENASCHIALGGSGAPPEEITAEEFQRLGYNTSTIHVDFMIGSSEIDVDGITTDGVHEPILRRGEWAFDA
jgi:aminopeptidase